MLAHRASGYLDSRSHEGVEFGWWRAIAATRYFQKPDGIDGAEVRKYYRDGRIREIAEYCETDVLNTYRVWLRYELFRGQLTAAEFEASEAKLIEFVKARGNIKPHLTGLT